MTDSPAWDAFNLSVYQGVDEITPSRHIGRAACINQGWSAYQCRSEEGGGAAADAGVGGDEGGFHDC